MGRNPLKSQAEGVAPLRPSRPALLAGMLVIVALTFLAYLPALKGPFIWDDDAMLTQNALVKSADGLGPIWCSTRQLDYFPLTFSSFWLEWRAWGMKPVGYRVANVLLHALSAVLLWRVLTRLKVPGAWVAALLFALHPIGVASVAWVAERKNTLSLPFFLLSLLLYLRFDEKPVRPSALCRASLYFLSLASFLLALLSKTSVVMLPLLLLGCGWWLRGHITRRDLWRTLPFFVLALALGLATVWFQTCRAMDGATRPVPLLERLLGGGWAFWRYLFNSLLPVRLAIFYPRGSLAPASFLAWLPELVMLGGFIAFLPPRHPWQRAGLFAFCSFLLLLLPVLGFFDMSLLRSCVAADHWQYLALMVITALVVGSVTRFTEAKVPQPLLCQRILATLCIAGCFCLTWRRASTYAHPERLWTQTLQVNPNSWIAHGNLAKALEARGERAAALAHWRTALELKPDWPEVLNNLAWTLATSSDPSVYNPSEAVRLAEQASASQPNSPNYLDTLGVAYAATGRFAQATAAADQAMAAALAADQPDAAERYRSRRELYRQQRAYREP